MRLANLSSSSSFFLFFFLSFFIFYFCLFLKKLTDTLGPLIFKNIYRNFLYLKEIFDYFNYFLYFL